MTDDVRAAATTAPPFVVGIGRPGTASLGTPSGIDSAHASDTNTLLKTWIAEDSALKPTVTIEAELLNRLVAYVEDCQRYFDRKGWPASNSEIDLLARAKAAREGK